MTITMLFPQLSTMAEIQAFLAAHEGTTFTVSTRHDCYSGISETLQRLRYPQCSKRDKGLVRRYLRLLTGYSPAQLSRLIAAWRRAPLRWRPPRRHRFPTYYTSEDIRLLAQMDVAHLQLSGPATTALCHRAYAVFHDARFVRLAHLSVSHLYNLRKTRRYRQRALVMQPTRPTGVTIGERRRPDPNGQPGFIRVDTVHQGDRRDGQPGVYHINVVDEVTQWELVACVETISERHLHPLLEGLLRAFPFRVQEFHADNGSEFINKTVARMLNRLRVPLSKSRPRRHNDNALVETKNGAVVRKHVGYLFIPQREAAAWNTWCQEHLNPYLNFHRPCAFATTTVDARGKERKRYRPQDYCTPYEKFRSLKKAHQYLRPGMTWKALNRQALACSDLECATRMQEAKARLLDPWKEAA